MNITIQIPIPSKRLAIKSPRHQKKRETAVNEARWNAKVLCLAELDSTPPPFWEKARVTASFHYRTWVKPDWKKALKSLAPTFDGFVDAGIVERIEDIVPERPTRAFDKKNPRVVITITEEEE